MSDKTRNLLIGIITVGIIAMTVAYAALSQTLNISGSCFVNDNGSVDCYGGGNDWSVGSDGSTSSHSAP